MIIDLEMSLYCMTLLEKCITQVKYYIYTVLYDYLIFILYTIYNRSHLGLLLFAYRNHVLGERCFKELNSSHPQELI